jgi:threonylcarbamoyladenosine tRNA methylthiotransferase MtaB
MPSFFIQNFGCRVNQAEAFNWADAFQAEGFRLEPDWRRSDLILVNSCTLTSRADRDVRSFIRKIGRENSRARLVVTGCYAERARQEMELTPRVLVVLPNSEKAGLPERVMALLGQDVCRRDNEAPVEEAFFRARAMLKIQDGCDNCCTFCIIPSVRGGSTSLGENEVLACIHNLVSRGYREIVLAGIHLSSYGRDLRPEASLAGLLRRIETVEGLGRVRLSSLDPRQTDDGLLACVAGNPKICQHFHFSLQHASKRVLDKMGRAIGPDRYESILGSLRYRSPSAALGADVIVGFPEETDEDFAALEDFLRRSPLTYFHVFSYSPRDGTPAALKPQTSEFIKRARSSALRRLSTEKSFRFRQSFAGRELDAIVIRSSNDRKGHDDEEGERRDPSGGRPGAADAGSRRPEVLTDNYVRVFVPSSAAPERESVRVRITRVLPGSTEGVIAPGG